MSADKTVEAAARAAEEGAIEAMTRLPSQRVTISVDGLTAVYLVAHLQLALRHEEKNGPAAQSMTALAWAIRDDLISREPQVASIIDSGWAGIPSNRRN
jgi:hypothetical protein